MKPGVHVGLVMLIGSIRRSILVTWARLTNRRAGGASPFVGIHSFFFGQSMPNFGPSLYIVHSYSVLSFLSLKFSRPCFVIYPSG